MKKKFACLRTLMLFGCFAGILWIQCRNDSPPAIPVKIERFDHDLIAVDTLHLSAELENLAKKYPDMLPLFAGTILRDPTNPHETPEQAVSNFLRTPQIRALFDTVHRRFPNLDFLESELGIMMANYKKYFPEKPVPRVVAMVSEFTTDVFTAGDSLCGVSLDMFLGAGFPGYNPDIFPTFIQKQFYPEYIKVRLAKALAQNLLDTEPGSRLLDHMIFQGKILYVTDLLLPDTPDSLKMGYSAEKMAGCYANEAQVWARILSQNLLYSTDFTLWRKMVTPSPNSPIIFDEAPGEIGSWVGWQIVKAFMRRQPDFSIQKMLAFSDAQKFLELAKYKPKR